jgi:transposase
LSCRKPGDYHEEMNSTVFEEWFKKVLPTLEESSIIVMDNAYHSRKIEKIPTGATRKNDSQEWLRSKNIPYEENMVKAKLL